MSGESLSTNASTNTEKKLGKYVTLFLEFVFEKEKDRMCASAILKELPLPRSTGRQRELVAILTPGYPPHYWNTIRKLKSMGVIKLYTERISGNRGKGKYIKAYVFNPDFVRLLEKMANGFDNLRTGRKPKEEEE